MGHCTLIGIMFHVSMLAPLVSHSFGLFLSKDAATCYNLRVSPSC
jgi:nitrate reductase gamma subunit